MPPQYSPSLKYVLQQILRVRNTPTSATLMIFFQIDEFQRALPARTHLLRSLGSLLALSAPSSPFKDTSAILMPILYGTWTGKLTLATELALLDIILSGMDSIADAHGLFSDYIAKYSKNVTVPVVGNRFHPTFCRCLA